jgi:peptidoglycan/xylan/chitin deacetylase (PgdA/CDA1 family)
MPQYSTNQKSIPFPWPDGIKCAVSLTFDDSRLSQIDMGIPLLDRFNIKGTFYITPDLTEKHLPDWIEASENGHEIRNHTMTHPCTGN